MSRGLLVLLVAVLAFFLGVAGYALWQSKAHDEAVREEATLLLERVRDVMKLVTVEGDVSELYHSTSSRSVTLYLPLPARFSFNKEASVEVRGKILVGYDLEQLDLSVDAERRTLIVRNLPDPEILAIDHELIYRDLNESWFNTFSVEDYSELNRKAKERLREEALGSELMVRAREQGNSVLLGIEGLARGAGYELVVESTRAEPEFLLKQ